MPLTEPLQFRSLANYASRDPNDANNCNRPRREKGDRHTNHAQAPHDCACALRQCTPDCGKQAALPRHDIALAVNLDRNVRRCVCFIDLRTRTVLTLHAHVLNLAYTVERL